MAEKFPVLEPGKIYHLFNHAVGSDSLFLQDENYRYFLSRYAEFFEPIAETFAYCLMPNHFHFAVRIKEEKKLTEFFTAREKALCEENPDRVPNPVRVEQLPLLASRQLSHLCNAYTQAINKQTGRKGNLFRTPFKRKEVIGNEYLKRLIHYIHFNPVHHGICESINDWNFCSFHSFLLNQSTRLLRAEVLALFETNDGYKHFHQLKVDLSIGLGMEM